MNQLMTNNYLPILTLGSVTSRGNEHKKHWVKQLASDHDISEGLEASHLDYPVELVIWFQAIGHVNDEVPEILHCRKYSCPGCWIQAFHQTPRERTVVGLDLT